MQHKGVTVVESQGQLKELLQTNAKAVLNFWADWCEPAKQMNAVFAELAKSTPEVAFYQASCISLILVP